MTLQPLQLVDLTPYELDDAVEHAKRQKALADALGGAAG